jgi:D-alanyl-D-alanine carboxypeptidase
MEVATMKRRFVGFASAALAMLLVACGAPVGSDSQTLAAGASAAEEFEPYVNQRFTRTLESIFDRSSDSNTLWSIEVRAHGPRGQKLALYSRSSSTSVKPASTMKLLTSWTAFQEIASASQIGSDKYNYIREMMKYSDNDMAENVLSWCGGVNSSYDMLTRFNISRSANLNLADGSGLSYNNRLAAHDLVQLLSVVRSSDKIKAFRSLLPVAGVDGTLAGRMGNVNGTVAAKTGTLTTDPTAALAGYADSKTGWQVVFAMLGDSVPSVDSGRAAIDDAMFEIVNTLNYLPLAATTVAAQ